MKRRDLLAAAGGIGLLALSSPALSQARQRTLRFVPSAGLTSFDPIWTTAGVTRNHGYMVFDSLYGLDGQLRPQPQMAEGASFDDGNLTVTVTLRRGLKFHDGEPVRAADCVASLRRWMKRSPMGQKLETVTDELSALDDLRLRFRLKRPFPLILHALGAVGPQALVMPERLAVTDAFQQVREVVGSGPYRFKADEFNTGSLAAYERFAGYQPSPAGRAEVTAGPKVAHFDRVEWLMIPDASTAAGALRSGEVDWFEQPPPDILDLFRRDRNVRVEKLDRFPQVGGLRFNQLTSPFSDKRLRQAVLPAVNQDDFMLAVAGDDRSLWQTGVGFFTPGGPSASDVGTEVFKGARSTDRAKELMRQAGYANQPMRQLGATDLATVAAITLVAEDLFRRLGFNNDVAMSDWGTVTQRRASREPLEQGGWSVFSTNFGWFEMLDPAVNVALRGNGTNAYFGWPTMPAMESMRDRWFDAPDDNARKVLAEDMQRLAFDEVPLVPLGAFFQMTALRDNLRDRLQTLPVFWNVRRG